MDTTTQSKFATVAPSDATPLYSVHAKAKAGSDTQIIRRNKALSSELWAATTAIILGLWFIFTPFFQSAEEHAAWWKHNQIGQPFVGFALFCIGAGLHLSARRGTNNSRAGFMAILFAIWIYLGIMYSHNIGCGPIAVVFFLKATRTAKVYFDLGNV